MLFIGIEENQQPSQQHGLNVNVDLLDGKKKGYNTSTDSPNESKDPNFLSRLFSNDRQRRERSSSDNDNNEDIGNICDGGVNISSSIDDDDVFFLEKNKFQPSSNTNEEDANIKIAPISSTGHCKSITMNSTLNELLVLKSNTNSDSDTVKDHIFEPILKSQVALKSLNSDNTNTVATGQTHNQQQIYKDDNTISKNNDLNLMSRSALFFQRRRINAKAKFHEEKLTNQDIEVLEKDLIEKNVKEFDPMDVQNSRKNIKIKILDKDTEQKNNADKIVSIVSSAVFAPEIITQAIEPEDGEDGKGFYRRITPLMNDDDSKTLSKDYGITTSNAKSMEDFDQSTFQKMGISENFFSRRWAQITKKIGAAIIAPELYMDDLLRECEDPHGRYVTIEVENEKSNICNNA